MCGIAGVYSARKPPSADELFRMVRAIRHRGPDDLGFFRKGDVGLGMARLSIVDVERGQQPLFSNDGRVVVICNGEIYNHPSLRPHLEARGYCYRTNSDVETLVYLYEEYGTDFLQHIRGMFGLALWDDAKQRLLLARDRLGIKPLYYAKSPDELVFGSEIKSLISSRRRTLSIDPIAVDLYFKLGYIPSPLSIFREIRKLPPAHVLVMENGQECLTPYWKIPTDAYVRSHPKKLADEFLQLFRESLREHLMSDVPLGAFLSGGVDSSFLVANLAPLLTEPLNTFTIGFGGNTGGHLDERPAARETSRQYGTRHHEFVVEPRPQEVLPQILSAFDEPFADDGVIPTFYLCRETRGVVKVALSGLGADELFAGYERHLGLHISQSLDRLPAAFRQSIAALVDRIPEPRDGRYTINHVKRFGRASVLSPRIRYDRYCSIFTPQERRRLLSDTFVSEIGVDGSPCFLPEKPQLTGALNQDIQTYLPEDVLALTDRIGMWHSLEVRVPFLDHRLVELACRLPPCLKIRGWEKKYLLRRMASPMVPRTVMRQRKQGFSSPFAAWLHIDLREMVSDLLAPDLVARSGWMSNREVQRLLDDHWSRRELNDRKIFTVLMFQRWLEQSKSGNES